MEYEVHQKNNRTAFVTGEPTVGGKKRTLFVLEVCTRSVTCFILFTSLGNMDECFSTDVLLSTV